MSKQILVSHEKKIVNPSSFPAMGTNRRVMSKQLHQQFFQPSYNTMYSLLNNIKSIKIDI